MEMIRPKVEVRGLVGWHEGIEDELAVRGEAADPDRAIAAGEISR